MTQDNKLDMFRLIKLVEMNRLLWDKTNANYSNKEIRKIVWEEIAQTLGVTVEGVRGKWNNLKDGYKKELKRFMKQQVNGDGVAAPKWPYFDSMNFFNGNINLSKPNHSAESLLDVSETDFIRNPQLQSQSSVSFNQKLKHCPRAIQNSDSQLSNTGNTMLKIAAQGKSKKNCKNNKQVQVQSAMNPPVHVDEDYHFLLSLLQSLRRIPSARKSFFRMKILQILCEEENFLIMNPMQNANSFNPNSYLEMYLKESFDYVPDSTSQAMAGPI